MNVRLHVKCNVFLSGLNETSIFEECSRFKLYENPSNGSAESFRADGQTDTTKLYSLLSAVFTNALKNEAEHIYCKIKVKVTLEQATKAQSGSRCIALPFLQPRR